MIDIWLGRIEKLKRIYLRFDLPEERRRKAFRLAFTLSQRLSKTNLERRSSF